MIRSLFSALVLCTAVACFNPAPAPASATTGRNGFDAGTRDAGAADSGTSGSDGGALVVLSSNNKLPPAWVVTDATVLAQDGSGVDGGALSHAFSIVNFTGASTVGTLGTTAADCPVFSPGGSGGFCDGFNLLATTQGDAPIAVNAYEFARSTSFCGHSTADAVASVAGIWQPDVVTERYDGGAGDRFAVALTDCAGLGGYPFVDGSGTAGSTAEIKALLAAYPAAGTLVTVRGVVTAASVATAGTPFTLILQDPLGGERSAIKVYKPKLSDGGIVVTAPKVGDYIRVTGVTSSDTPAFREVKLN